MGVIPPLKITPLPSASPLKIRGGKERGYSKVRDKDAAHRNAGRTNYYENFIIRREYRG